MRSVRIRQAPSGPFEDVQIPETTGDIVNISNVPGSTLTQALNGLIQRQSIAATPMTPDLQLVGQYRVPLQNGLMPFEVSLPTPLPEAFYRAQLDFDVNYQNYGLGPGGPLDFVIETQVDSAGWVEMANGSVTLASAYGFSRHISLTLPPTLGSVLGVLPGSSLLAIRGQAGALGIEPIDGSVLAESKGLTGTLTLCLFETL